MNRINVRALLAPALGFIAALSLGAVVSQEIKLVKSKDGKSVGYTDTPKLPWTSGPFFKHDPDRPLPREVTPGTPSISDTPGTAPSDAIVLFDGKNTEKWKPNKWKLEAGVLTAAEGDIETLDSFGDCQLHLEWSAPNPPHGSQMDRGNSGVFMMSRYEIQISDSFTEKIYADGSAASVYGETPPMVNATRPPGQWQVYDIIFKAPVFKDGKLASPAKLTMFHNGLLVHLDTEIHGPVAWRTIAAYQPHPDKQPLKLQYHGNPVRFRNIWIRPLDLAAEEKR